MVRRHRVVDQTTIAAKPQVPGEDAPEVERIVSDVETLKALSDPLRLRILETMVSRAAGEPSSVKELAAALGVPQTRLYHHIELLLERDLIRAAGQRVVSGIIETRYRVAALSLRLDPKLLSGEGAAASDTSAVIATVLEGARGDIEIALREATTAPETPESSARPLVARGLSRLTPARARELRERLAALVEEYEGDPDDPSSRPYGLLLALYAVPQSKEAPGE
jgi:DNA-binding transcriptional ArsR family regulator